MNFNPRSHERSDVSVPSAVAFSVFQSTLPREERPYEDGRIFSKSRFQSTLPREERPRRRALDRQLFVFQSTLPREERQKCRVWLNNQRNFNPRSHERSDNNTQLFQPNKWISIHAPTRGATFSRASNVVLNSISIHAPTRGATHAVYFFHTLQIFQSTLPREERRTTQKIAIV